MLGTGFNRHRKGKVSLALKIEEFEPVLPSLPHTYIPSKYSRKQLFYWSDLASQMSGPGVVLDVSVMQAQSFPPLFLEVAPSPPPLACPSYIP